MKDCQFVELSEIKNVKEA